ncbi:hypothetical protein TIFTF001_001666 [Ficus carica]|uniref:Uncharacterized protein n=1 Tax=Ficus carica TaxID=3494 RepID=A0AA87ZA06_FICCA|nr:hypothetical protein TIFTF001_001666 [Ficus carica]
MRQRHDHLHRALVSTPAETIAFSQAMSSLSSSAAAVAAPR